MRRTAGQATVADPPAPRFELDRVVVDAGTVRVVGWWYGVRGRRFIRPSLTAIGGEARARALAELEHKPWSAEAGQQWLAEFVWEHPLHDVEAFELAVAPDLAVRIPLPEAPQPMSAGAAPPGRAQDEVAKPRQTRPAARSENRRGRVAQRHRSPPDADASLRLRLARAEQHLARVLAERDAAVTERDRLLEADGLAAAERDRLLDERVRLLDERGAALGRAATVAAERARAVADARRVVEERDRALRERDDALRLQAGAEVTRDALAEQHRAALAERDRLSQALEQARAERTGLMAQYARDRPERERLARERDEALALRDQTAAERDRHLLQRDEVADERDRTIHELERVRRQRDAALAHAERERAQTGELRDAITELRSRLGSGLVTARQSTEPQAGAVELKAVSGELPRPRGSAGQLRPSRASEPPRPAPQSRRGRRMLARAMALVAVLAVVLIVIAIVLSR